MSHEEAVDLEILPTKTNKSVFLRSGCPTEDVFISYKGLIYKFALFYTRKFHKGDYLEDFVSVGYLALIHAWRKFDDTQGWHFSTYLSWWLRRYMGKYLNEIYSVVIQKPSNGDRVIISQRKRDYELNATIPNMPEAEFVDVLQSPVDSTEQTLMRIEYLTYFRAIIMKTAKNDKERIIIKERILTDNPTKLRILAEQLNLTKQGVSIIETKLKRRIRETLSKSKQFKLLSS
jgi:RNA polymerase sigma factor (sigma-70 family)